MEKSDKKIIITLDAKIKNLDLTLAKADRYVSLLKEAKTLAEELASIEFEISTN